MKYKKSFLKWAGGKYKLLDVILPYLEGYKTYIEPFSGSGVVWINAQNKIKHVNDINKDLYNLYNAITDTSFIDYTKSFFTEPNEETFYKLREEFNTTQDMRKRASLFIYLNRHCFNGLCRYNKYGNFNVPYGKIVTTHFPGEEMLEFIKSRNGIKFYNKSYEKMFDINSDPKDTVMYCDPPYDVFPNSDGFTDYAGSPFGKDEQKNLSELIKKAAFKVIASNHDTEYVRELYKGLQFIKLNVRRNISCGARNLAKELIIIKE